jgi:hypothetical protein
MKAFEDRMHCGRVRRLGSLAQAAVHQYGIGNAQITVEKRWANLKRASGADHYISR